MMSRYLHCSTVSACLLFAAPSHAIEIWHSNTVWANQGMCSATFMLDGGMESVGSLEIGFDLVDAKNNLVAHDALQVEPFGDSDATRYQTAFAEGEHYCESNLTLRLTSLALVNGKTKQPLPLSLLTPRAFIPFPIINPQADH